MSILAVLSSYFQTKFFLIIPADAEPLSLQDICRFAVRSILRRIIDIEHPELKKRPPRVPRKRVKKRTLRQLVIPIFGSHSDSEDNEIDSDDHHNLPDYGRGGFFVSNGRTSRAIIELSSLLEKRSTRTRNAERRTTETKMESQDDSTVQANSSAMADAESALSSIIKPLEEMSEDEYSSGNDDVEPKNDELEKEEEPKESTSAIKQKNKVKETKREKFDSGIVEDIENGKAISSDSDHDEDEELDSEFSDSARVGLSRCRISQTHYSFLKVLDSDSDSDNCENGAEKEEEVKNCSAPPVDEKPQVNVNNYTTYMKEKIKMLPLPMTLKYFLNLDRAL